MQPLILKMKVFTHISNYKELVTNLFMGSRIYLKVLASTMEVLAQVRRIE